MVKGRRGPAARGVPSRNAFGAATWALDGGHASGTGGPRQDRRTRRSRQEARRRSSRTRDGRPRADDRQGLRDHGFFVFFAPKDNPVIAGVIYGEHNEHGFLGAPIAKHVIETYYAKQEGKPLPQLTPKAPPAAPEVDPDSPPAALPVAVASNETPATNPQPGTN